MSTSRKVLSATLIVTLLVGVALLFFDHILLGILLTGFSAGALITVWLTPGLTSSKTAPTPAPSKIAPSIVKPVPTERERTFKIVGVTFKNEDGTSRQKLIQKIDEAGVYAYEFSFEEYDYEGETAIGLFFEDDDYESRQLGNISRAEVDSMLRIMDQITDFDVEIIGGDGLSYGIRVTVKYI